MQRQISFRQYRIMDILFFTLLLCLGEWLIVMGATRWFPREAYTLSLTAAVTGIVMMRWGVYAALPALAGGAVFCLASGAAGQHFLIFCLGNLLCMALLPLLRRIGWQRIGQSGGLSMVFGLACCLAMDLGRMIIALCLGHPIPVCLGFLTTDTLSWLFSALILWIARRLDGMIEDQKHYLFRIQKEKENEQNRGA